MTQKHGNSRKPQLNRATTFCRLTVALALHSLLGGKARALLQGRTHVSTDDIIAMAKPVLRHRIVLNFAAESEGMTADQVIDKLIETTPAREGDLSRDPRFQKIFAA